MELMLERDRKRKTLKHKITPYGKSQYVQDCMCDKENSCRAHAGTILNAKVFLNIIGVI